MEKKKGGKNPARKVHNQSSSGLVPVTVKTHRDKKGGHPHVIVEDIDDKHVSVGLSTHPTKGKGSKNYRLDKSPLNDGKTSYMRRQGTVAPKGEYERKRNGTMTPKDFAQAVIYGERAKQKYLDKKEDKKSNDRINAECVTVPTRKRISRDFKRNRRY